jgi:preprotein translocase subunit SecG
MEILSILLNIFLFLIALFLILLVLVQRGRGGGLAGALGGMGGQSAFGTKAGDVFTRVTIVVAAVWILLCAAAVKLHQGNKQAQGFSGGGVQAQPGPAAPQGGAGGATPAASPTGSAPAPASTTPAP